MASLTFSIATLLLRRGKATIASMASMHITMVKKKTKDGVECQKCASATEHLRGRGLWTRIDEVIWAIEDDPSSPGMVLGDRLGVERAPFFVVRDAGNEQVYTSVVRLIQDHLRLKISDEEKARHIDPDDVGGI